MRKLLLTHLGALALTVAALTPAAAFVPTQGGIAAAAAIADPLIEAKSGKSKGWKKHARGRPPGWSRGRKVGWRGHSMPPGQRKKYR